MSGGELVPLRGEVVDPADRLGQLAATIREQHKLTRQAGEAMILHAIACGEALLDAKVLVPAGRWQAWVDETLPYGVRRSMTRNYMRLASLKEHVDPSLSVTANVHLVRGLEKRSSATPRVPEEAKREALRLHATGEFTKAEIARMVGTTTETIHAWVDPEYARRKAQRQRARRAERRVAERGDQDMSPREQRAHRYGEPGRAAIGQAVRRLAQAQGKGATCEALLDLAAICDLWARRLGAPLPDEHKMGQAA